MADGTDSETVELARLLLSEMVTNAVTHGVNGGSPTGVAIWVAPAYIQMEVEDGGPGFEPRPRLPEADQTGGRGLWLVDRLASAWGVSIGPGTTVWCRVECAR